jgi:antitoxin ParD1/3/4
LNEQDRLRAVELEQLRDDIRQGLNSGPSKASSADDAKREGRARRARKAP